MQAYAAVRFVSFGVRNAREIGAQFLSVARANLVEMREQIGGIFVHA